MSAPDRSAALLDLPQAGRLLTDAASALRAANDPTARLDAELLVAHAFDRDRAWLRAHPEATIDPGAAARLQDWIARRASGEPIAYLRGFKEWLSLRIATDPRALIPRPETELLAEMATAEIAARLVDGDRPLHVWEIATGGGAVSVALALRFRAALLLGRLRLTASDLSADALELAAENLAAHGIAGLVALACGDMLEPAPRDARFDLLIANPPYVRSAEVAAAGGSLGWEPRMALDGGADGLLLLRRLVADLPAHLAPGGVALLEIGADQAAPLRDLLTASGTPLATSVHRDLAGLDRVLRVARSVR